MDSILHLRKVAIGIAITGGAATFIAINAIPYILNEKIRKSDHYKQAIQLLHNHPEAVKYLGEPIMEKRIIVTKEKDFGQTEELLWVSVPVVGTKAAGKLYYDCTINKNDSQPYHLSRVELTLNNLENYKLLIKRKD